MTDELQKLVAELRHPIQRNERYYEPLCARAADELEWLVDFVKSLESAADQNLKEAKQLQGENDWLRTALRAAQTALAQSNAGLPPLRYSDKVEKAADGTETRRLELSDAEPVAWTSRQSYSELKGWHWVDCPSAEWRCVPKEPTREMITAGGQAYQTGDFAQPIEDQFDQDKQRALPVWEAMLNAAPIVPRPDASAGLIEAEKIALNARQKWGSEWDDACVAIAEAIRSRAADRSEK